MEFLNECALLIDDDEIACYLQKTLMEELKIAKRIECFSSGIDAIAFLQTNIPSLIFVDMKLPEMDGIEIIESIRALPYGNRIRIIGLSNYFTNNDIVQLQILGVSAMVEKPLTEEKLQSIFYTKSTSE
jgi:CheY-like chemotaxis protein